MVQGPNSHAGVYFCNNNNKRAAAVGFDGFSASDDFQNGLFGSANHKRHGSQEEDEQQQQQQVDVFKPLGLSLKKTPSFIDLIEAKLSQGTTAITCSSKNQTNSKLLQKPRSRKLDSESQSMVEKLKASNFTATLLRIGTWERVAKNEGDLVAKCYYAKRKLVWEILECGLKSKVECQWSDISAIRTAFPENQPGILEIELKNTPLFYREMNPQPRKHTLWQPTTDFTGGQASVYRRHYLQFPEGTLEKHYEKLLQFDRNLLRLSQEPFPDYNSPFFETDSHPMQDFYIDFKSQQQRASCVVPFPYLPIQNHPGFVPPYQAQKLNQPFTTFVTPNDHSRAPTMSAMDVSGFDEVVGYTSIPQETTSLHMTGQVREPVLMGSTPSRGCPFPPRYGEPNIENLQPNQWLRNEMYHQLLDEQDQFQRLDEQRVMSKVKSMARLLEEDSEEIPTQNGSLNYEETNKYNRMELNSELASIESLNWIPPQGSTDHNSFMNLPRIPSYPSFLVDPSLDISMTDFSNMDVHHHVASQWR